MKKKHRVYKEVPIESLNPAAYNPRDISDVAFEGLKESLKKFDCVEPLVFNKRTQTLVGGHQRLKALEALGYTSVPIIELDLSLAEEKALNVTLNNAAIAGHYTETLQTLLEEIKIDLGDDYNVLRLDTLEVKTDWDATDTNPDDIEPNLDGIRAKIIVKCPQEAKPTLLTTIREAITKGGFEGVEIDG